MRHVIDLPVSHEVGAGWLATSSAPRHPKLATSFDAYVPQPFDDQDMATATKALTQEQDGRVVIDRAKGTWKNTLPAMPPLNKPRPADGFRPPMDKDAVWDKKKRKPAAMVSDLYGWNADIAMRRAKEAAILTDNALLEVRKQQEAARYHSQQALLYEAAAHRELRQGGKDKARSIHPPDPLKINEYPVPPDAYFSTPTLPSPPGWEAPGAAEAPVHGPSPMNTFRIHANAASAPWMAAVIGPPPFPARASDEGPTSQPTEWERLSSFL